MSLSSENIDWALCLLTVNSIIDNFSTASTFIASDAVVGNIVGTELTITINSAAPFTRIANLAPHRVEVFILGANGFVV